MLSASLFRKSRRITSPPRRRLRLEQLENRRLLAATPWDEQAKLIPADSAEGDLTGFSVAVSGDTMVVGALSHQDADGFTIGAAYVYQLNQNGTPNSQSDDYWELQTKLISSNPTINGQFGYAVAIEGDTIAVSSRLDNAAAQSAGAVYVFSRSGTTWSEQQLLTASDPATYDSFGASLAICDQTIVVGSQGNDLDTNGDGIDDLSNAGSAYVFAWNGTSWNEQQRLISSDISASDNFGYSVAISGDSLVVGSRGDDLDNGDQNAGAAYVFVREGTSWIEQQKLTASDAAADDSFGGAVAISDDLIVVGSSLDDLDTDGDGIDDLVKAGSAYVFANNGTRWIQEQKLTASDGAANDSFGSTVSISGETVLVGSPRHDQPEWLSGAAYVFVRDETGWSEQQMLTASDAAEIDEFGTAVEVDDGVIVIGARRTDDNGENSGSAYVFVYALIDVNEAPSITSATNVEAAENQLSVIDLSATDPDGETEAGGGLTYSLTGGVDQALFSIDTDTGILTFQAPPDFENPGDADGDNLHEVQVTVTDAAGLSDTQDLAVTVINVNESPSLASSIADVEANQDAVDAVFDLSGTFFDIDAGDALTLTVVGNSNGDLVATSFNGTDLTLDYLDGQHGTAEITIRATDVDGLFVEDTFTVTVLSTQDQLQNLIDDSTDLVGLQEGQTNSLTSKLDNAIDNLDDGHVNSGINQMESFINQVNALLNSNRISQSDADALIDAANAAINSALGSHDQVFSDLGNNGKGKGSGK